MEDNKYQRLVDDAKRYARMHLNLLRLEVLDKTSRVLSLFLLIILAMFTVLAAFAFFALAVAAALAPTLGTVASLCIVGGALLVVLLIIFLLRKQLIINPIVTVLSKIMFHTENADDHDEKE